MYTCVSCQNTPAKWQEKNTPENVFCGRICQMEYHLVGLKDDPNIIGLESGDGYRIQLTAAQAREMKLIEDLLDEFGPDNYLPVSNMSKPTLKQIQKFFRIGHVETAELSDNDFLNLLEAANYLYFERLLYHLMPEWVNNRPFPGRNALKNYMSAALYFFNGDWNTLQVNEYMKRPFLNYIRGHGVNQWQIRMAARDGHLMVVERLLQIPSVDPTANNNFTIQITAARGYLAVVDRLLQDGRVNPATDDNYPIRRAAGNGHLEVVERLLEDGRVDPAAPNNENIAIKWAAQTGHLDVVERLLRDDRVDPAAPNNRNYAIILAAQNGHLDVVERLLQDDRVNIEAIRDIPEVYHRYKHARLQSRRV